MPAKTWTNCPMYEINAFLQVLRKHGFRPSEEELKAMIANCEKDEKNGGIDFNEFIAMMTRQGSDVEEDIAHSFRVFDRDSDGLITKEELMITMNNLGEPLSEEEVITMIEEADLDGDGKINFVEFQKLFMSLYNCRLSSISTI